MCEEELTKIQCGIYRSVGRSYTGSACGKTLGAQNKTVYDVFELKISQLSAKASSIWMALKKLGLSDVVVFQPVQPIF